MLGMYSCKGIRSLVKGQSVKGAERHQWKRFPDAHIHTHTHTHTEYPSQRTDRERNENSRAEEKRREEKRRGEERKEKSRREAKRREREENETRPEGPVPADES